MPLRNYETAFTLTPVLSAKQMEDAVQSVRSILEKQGAKIIHEKSYGLTPLAYPIQKKKTGFFYVIEFSAPPSTIAILEKTYRYDDRIMRFLTFALDKHAVLYNAAKRKQTEEVAANPIPNANDRK